jgi:hypothetical protein
MIAVWIEPVQMPLFKCAVVAVVALALGAWLWGFVPSLWRRRLAPWGMAAAIVAGIVCLCLSRAPDWDEMEHLHSSWLVDQGLWPYTDFWQHHSPLLWIVLGPLTRIMPHTSVALDLWRAVAFLASVAAGALVLVIARRLDPRPGVLLAASALWLGAAGPCEFHDLRPDLFANVCSLGAMALLISSRSAPAIFSSGALLAFAVSFTPKHAPLLAILPVVALWERLGPRGLVRMALLYFAGIVVGSLPLTLWLVRRDLVGDFLYWTVLYNKDPRLRLGGELPLALAVLVVAWLIKVRANRWGSLQAGHRVLVAAFATTMVMLFIQPFHKLLYGVQFFVLLASAVGAGEAVTFLNRLWRGRRRFLCGALVGLYLLPDVLVIYYWMPKGEYLIGREEIGTLMALAGNEPVVLVPPEHPAFARDATDLNQPWQWYKWLHKPEIKARLQGFVPRVMKARPVMVLAGASDARLPSPKVPSSPVRGALVERLHSVGIITEKEAIQLRCFLQANYTLVQVGRHYYWLRKDRPMLAGVHEVELEQEQEDQP